MRSERQTRCAPTEFRAEEREGVKRIEGYFSVFDSPYELWEGATEMVDRHAFDDVLMDDVRALIDHESRLVLGRTMAGTLTLRVDDHGLWGSIIINEDDVDAMNLYARVKRGDVSQCSFGFEILKERTEYDEEAGTVQWTIEKVKLYEVSCVTFPAYRDTSISARTEDLREIRQRSAQAWKEKMKRRIRTEWR